MNVDVALAIQAASLARDYMLAIRLALEHDLTDCCIGCVTGKILYMRFRLNGGHTIYTCEACTEAFGRWLTDPANRAHANQIHDVE